MNAFIMSISIWIMSIIVAPTSSDTAEPMAAAAGRTAFLS